MIPAKLFAEIIGICEIGNQAEGGETLKGVFPLHRLRNGLLHAV